MEKWHWTSRYVAIRKSEFRIHKTQIHLYKTGFAFYIFSYIKIIKSIFFRFNLFIASTFVILLSSTKEIISSQFSGGSIFGLTYAFVYYIKKVFEKVNTTFQTS